MSGCVGLLSGWRQKHRDDPNLPQLHTLRELDRKRKIRGLINTMALLTYVMAVSVMLASVDSEMTRTEELLAALEREGYKNQNSSAATNIKRKILEGYNGEEHPQQDGPTEVRIGIYINSFYAVNEITMDYSISFYLRQAWQDPRLAFDSVDGVKSVKMGRDAASMWVPDTFFRNEKGASFHHITVRNSLTKVNSTGHVWHVAKISATFSCPMKLQRYPMDGQSLPLMFESFSHTMDTLYYSWLDPPVEIDPAVQLPQFTLKDIVLFDCSQNYTVGSFPCLEVRFLLRRDSGYFVMQVVIPSILLVILSWAGFWISIDAMAARVTLGVLTVLVMTTLSSGVQDTLPKVSYMKASDIWIGVCFIFIMASVFESAVVNTICQKEKGGKGKSGSDDQHPKADRVDMICKLAFPLAYLLFNIIFWAVYA